MNAEVVSIIVLALLFLLAAVRNVHLGAAALAATWLVGYWVFDIDMPTIVEGFPTGLFVTLVGVTYLFAFAKRAGAVDAIVYWAVKLVGGRISLLPWVMFTVTAIITAMGALTPAAAAIVGPIALGLAREHKISPALMGMAVIQGASAGSFSPIGVYGVIVNQVMDKNALSSNPGILFGAAFGFILLTLVATYFIHGGAGLWRADRDPDAAPVELVAPKVDAKLVLSLIAIAVLAGAAFGFDLDIGFVALALACLLGAIFSETAKGTVEEICWPTALLVCGVLTYVSMLQHQGVVDWLGEHVAEIGAPLVAALLICLIAAVVSALASTTGILGALVPLAVPFLLTGEVWPIGMVAALAISASVVDCSPFSTNGALMVAFTDEPKREVTYSHFLRWGVALVLIGPLVVWGALVVVPYLL